MHGLEALLQEKPEKPRKRGTDGTGISDRNTSSIRKPRELEEAWSKKPQGFP